MDKKPKRPRLGKTVTLIEKKTYEDRNQRKPNLEDPNESNNTPQENNSGIEELDKRKK